MTSRSFSRKWTIRARLAVWYAAVLSAFLLIFGAGVYLAVDLALLRFESRQAITLCRQISGFSDGGDPADQHTDEPQADESPYRGETQQDQTQNSDTQGQHDAGPDSQQMGVHEDVTDPSFLQTLSPGDSYVEIRDKGGRVINRSSNLRGGSLEQIGAPDEAVVRNPAGLGRIVLLHEPMQLSNGERDQVLVGRSLARMDHVLSLLAYWLMIVGLLCVSSALGGGYLLAGAALEPIDRITETARSIGRDRMGDRLKLVGPDDEVTRLGAAFDEMLDRLAAAMERERSFTADVSHELRTPITAMRGDLEVAMRSSIPRSDDDRRLFDHLLEEVNGLTRIVEQMLVLSRADRLDPLFSESPLELGALVCEACERMESLASQREAPLHFGTLEEVWVRGDPELLVRAILNLLENAVRYGPTGEPVTISVLKDEGFARCEIIDRGPGIAVEHLPLLFERFYRVEKSRSRALGGVGLGLTIARAIVLAHQGRVLVESQPGRGSRFSFVLPAIERPAAEEGST